MPQNSPSAILLTILISISIFILIWITFVSQGAITSAVKKIRNKKQTDFQENFKIGNKYFGSILGLNILLKIIIFFCSTIILSPFLILFLVKNSYIWGSLIVILSFLLVLPLSIILSFINHYALCYIVLQRKRIVQAIRDGLNLFISNWLITLETALILFLIEILAGLSFVILSSIAILIFSLFTFALNLLNFSIGISVISIFLIVFLLFTFLVINSFFGSFYYTYWTLLFIKLNNPKTKIVSKLVRIFHG